MVLRRLTIVAALAVLVIAPRLAHAVDPQLAQRFREIADILEAARRFPRDVPADSRTTYLHMLRREVAQPRANVAGARHLAHDSLKEEPKLYATMQADLAATDRYADLVEALLPPIDRMDAIDAELARDQPATDDELAALDHAIDDADAKIHDQPWATAPIAALRRFAGEVRAENVKVAAADAARRRAADESAKADAVLNVFRGSRGRIAELAARADTGGTLAESDVAAIEQDVADLDDRAPGAAFLLRPGLLRLELARRWQAPDAANAIATFFGGTVAAQGKSHGKQLAVSFTAAADQCYLLVGSFAAQGDTSRAGELQWQLPRGDQVQAFHVRDAGAVVEGFCAIKPEKVTAKADLDFEGSANALRYAVISFARDHFPASFGDGLVVERGDHCDPAYWKAMWTRPIPGTIAYDGREPVLLLDSAGEVVRLEDPNSLVSARATSKPSGTVSFGLHALEWGAGCPLGEKAWRVPRAPASLQQAACYAKVTSKYAAIWSRIERQRAAARDAGGIAPAVEDRATALMKQQDNDNARCDALANKVHTQLDELNATLVDQFLATPPADTTGRADLARAADAYRGR